MDPISIAGAAVGFLVPLLKKMLEGSVTKVGEGVADASGDAVRRLYDRVKARLSGHPYEQGLMAGLEEEPENAGRQRNLENSLAEILARDPSFAADVLTLVEEARSQGSVSVKAVDSGVVAGGDVSFSAGRDAVGRDKIGNGSPQQPG